MLRPSNWPLILHGLSREKVTAIHGGDKTPVQNDLLSPSEQTGRMLVRALFGDVRVKDTAERYVVAGHEHGSRIAPTPI